jgi:alcohol dehydrogenase class IV
MLPAVLQWSAPASGSQQALVSELMGQPGAPAADAVRNLVKRLGQPSNLASVGIRRDQFQAIAEHAMHDRGVRSNPRPINGPADIVEILELAA